MTRARTALAAFAQMLPATLVVGAVRPLFALHHGKNESAMHAFMSLNMLGAILFAPLVSRAARAIGARALLSTLLAADALLLVLVAHPLPTWFVLAARALEGGAHVGAATLIMAQAARLRARGDGHAIPLTAGAIMIAVATGSALGARLLALGPSAPFFVGAALLAALALSSRELVSADAIAPAARAPLELRALRVPLAAAFVARFTVGCIVVTFAVHAHEALRASDLAVGRWFAMLTVPFALSTYPLARAAERTSKAAMMGAGALVYGLSAGALAFAPAWAVGALMVSMGLGGGAIFGPTIGAAAEVAGEARERAMALVNAAGCAGMLFGPATAGILSACLRPRYGSLAAHQAVFLLASASVLGWLVCSSRWLLSRARREREAVAG